MVRIERRLVLTLGLLAPFLSACIVPLKKPVALDPDPIRPTINFSSLIEYAATAANAYASDETINEAYEHAIIRELPRSEGRYLLVFDHDERVQTVAVRGTANRRNAELDLYSIKIFDPVLGVYVHKGFKDAADEFIEDVFPFLQTDYRTFITGHSLGGAMACLLMMRLLEDGIPVQEVVTFGQPKVTNETGGEKFAAAPILRIINNGDIVAQIPPSNLVFDLSGTYEHFGPEIVLSTHRTYSFSPVHQPKDLLTDENWKNIKLTDLLDHQINNYIARLKALK